MGSGKSLVAHSIKTINIVNLTYRRRLLSKRPENFLIPDCPNKFCLEPNLSGQECNSVKLVLIVSPSAVNRMLLFRITYHSRFIDSNQSWDTHYIAISQATATMRWHCTHIVSCIHGRMSHCWVTWWIQSSTTLPHSLHPLVWNLRMNIFLSGYSMARSVHFDHSWTLLKETQYQKCEREAYHAIPNTMGCPGPEEDLCPRN